MIALWLGLALGAEVRVVRSGETVESIAAELGDPALAAVLRGENGLGAGAQPEIGAVLRIPPLAGHVDHDAVVIALSGSGTVDSPGRPTTPLALDARVPIGATACTDVGSFATLRLAVDLATGAHDDVNLLPGTCARVVAASSRPGAVAAVRASALALGSGGLEFRVADASEGALTVLTGAGVTTGTGGGFRVALERDGAARTEALYRPVAVIGQGVEREVGAGQGSRTRPGEAPSDPVSLLPPGQPVFPSDGAALRRPDFSWTAVPDALGYRLQLAVAPDFSDVVFATEHPAPRLDLDGLFLPTRVPGLWWRVTSFDLTGFEGPPSAARRLALPEGVDP